MTYRVTATHVFFVNDLEEARSLGLALKKVVQGSVNENQDNITHNHVNITDIDTHKSIPLYAPKPVVAYKGRQDLTTQVMGLVKILNDNDNMTDSLSSEDIAEKTVVLPEGETEYVINFKDISKALAPMRPDLKNEKAVNNAVKEAWVELISEQARKISFK